MPEGITVYKEQTSTYPFAQTTKSTVNVEVMSCIGEKGYNSICVDNYAVVENLHVKCNELLLTYYDGIDSRIDKVIFNNPATIVFWKDGTKTVVKCSDKDEFDPYFGLCCAITKKVIGNNSRVKKILKEATYCKEKKHD